MWSSEYTVEKYTVKKKCLVTIATKIQKYIWKSLLKKNNLWNIPQSYLNVLFNIAFIY